MGGARGGLRSLPEGRNQVVNLSFPWRRRNAGGARVPVVLTGTCPFGKGVGKSLVGGYIQSGRRGDT